MALCPEWADCSSVSELENINDIAELLRINIIQSCQDSDSTGTTSSFIHDAITADANATMAIPAGAKVLRLVAVGTMTSFTASVFSVDQDAAEVTYDIPLQGVSQEDDTDKPVAITAVNKGYFFDVSGISNIRVDVTGFTGTTLTIIAVVVK